jgi:hypothetical protein
VSGVGVASAPVTTGFNDHLVARWTNAFASWLAHAPLLGKVFGRRLVVIRYVGRRSGKVFETPVAYSRRDGEIWIGVGWPDKKSWWRNFLGAGGALTLVGLDGTDQRGHGVAERDAAGQVCVKVRLDAR